MSIDDSLQDDPQTLSNEKSTQIKKDQPPQFYPSPFLSNQSVSLSPTTQPSSTRSSDIPEALTQITPQRAQVEHNPVYFMDPLYIKDRPNPVIIDQGQQLNLEASLNRALLVRGPFHEDGHGSHHGMQVLASYTKFGFDVMTLGPKMIFKPPFLIEKAPHSVSNEERWWPAWSHGGPGGWR